MLSSFMTCYQICNKTGAISRAGTLTSEFYCGVRVAYFVVSFVMFCISYFVFHILYLLSFFSLPFYYLVLRFTASLVSSYYLYVNYLTVKLKVISVHNTEVVFFPSHYEFIRKLCIVGFVLSY